MTKSKKKRADKYQKPVSIQPAMQNVIKIAVTNTHKPKERIPKKVLTT